MRYQDYIGRSDAATDTIWPMQITGLAHSLGLAVEDVAPGGSLPPLWHWMLFQDWVPAAEVGPDGHPHRGGFLPPVHDLPRRMWAGSRVRFAAPLRAGDIVTRQRTIRNVVEKSGASGNLVFVTVHQAYTAAGVLAIEEEQDIVYRSAEGQAVKPASPAPAAPAAAFADIVQPSTVLLFRFSALTGNGHRIHYDQDYATNTEHYPGLVVHGPLQAIWLADLCRRHLPNPHPRQRLEQFSFRGLRPAFHQNPLHLEGWQDGATIRLRSRDPTGAICMQAEAVLA